MSIEAEIERHVAEVRAQLAAAGDELTPALEAGLRRFPRHGFVHRFRQREESQIRAVTPATLERHAAAIYDDTPLYQVDAEGRDLSSTLSRPSVVVGMAARLDLRPGQRVLEIGSGSGWLCAVMSAAVAPGGQVVGVEILPEIAQRSRTDLAALGADAVTIVTGDGALGHPPLAPYDRVILTAGSWDIPAALFAQTRPGARLIIPISNRGLDEDVHLMERTEAGFRSLDARMSKFVPLKGLGRQAPVPRLDELALWPAVRERVVARRRLWLGGRGAGDFIIRTKRLRSWLTRTEPQFRVVNLAPAPARLSAATFAFGLIDEARGGIALATPDWLTGHGDAAAYDRFQDALALWVARGMPPGIACTLEAVPADGGAAFAAGPDRWVERRGDALFRWSLDP